MAIKQNIHVNGQRVPAWRTASGAAGVTALAAIIFLAVWSPISAEVTQDKRDSSGVGFGGASLAGGSEHSDRAMEADRLAENYEQWLRAAHGRAGVAAQAQPLPSQF